MPESAEPKKPIPSSRAVMAAAGWAAQLYLMEHGVHAIVMLTEKGTGKKVGVGEWVPDPAPSGRAG